MVRMLSAKIRYTAVSTTPHSTLSTTALPTLLLARFSSLAPRHRLTKAQQPSPIITAMARATTVRGNTTVLAALP